MKKGPREGRGVVSSVKELRGPFEVDLVAQTFPCLDSLIAECVTTVEIKLGYWLDLENEAKPLRAARELEELESVTARRTFLVAHAFPP